jgi:hypothetical protein
MRSFFGQPSLDAAATARYIVRANATFRTKSDTLSGQHTHGLAPVEVVNFEILGFARDDKPLRLLLD